MEQILGGEASGLIRVGGPNVRGGSQRLGGMLHMAPPDPLGEPIALHQPVGGLVLRNPSAT